MKPFIYSHDSFLEDLFSAGKTLSAQDSIIGDALLDYAQELRNFDAATGWIDPLHDDNIFRLSCGDARSSWKRWQCDCYALAKKYDGQLFTYGTISDLVKRLNRLAAKHKNGQPIKDPDWQFCWTYKTRPSVGIGEGCTIVFEPVRGYYLIDGDNE